MTSYNQSQRTAAFANGWHSGPGNGPSQTSYAQPGHYQNSERRHNSNVLDLPVPGARSRSRRRYPPSPSVEDEVVSLSREHSPILPDLVAEEPKIRGSVDQFPIILEANYDATKQRPYETSLRSSSSSESLGPRTPSGSFSHNQEKRFVFCPKDVINKEAKLNTGGSEDATAQKVRVEKEARKAKKDIPRLDSKSIRGADSKIQSPLQSTREPSLYAYASNSGKSTFSGDYVMSPDGSSPHGSGGMHPRFHSSSTSTSSRGSNEKSFSASSKLPQKPGALRHESAIGYAGEATSPSFVRSHPALFPQTPSSGTYLPPMPTSATFPLRRDGYSKPTEISSSDSDISPDEVERKRGSRHDSRKPSGAEVPRQSSAVRFDEARQVKNPYIFSPKPAMPRTGSGTWDPYPAPVGMPDPRSYGSSVPITSYLPHRPLNKHGVSPRPSPLSSPVPSRSPSPPASPNPESKRYGHGVGSSTEGRGPKTAPRPSSRPNSRPSSPRSAGFHQTLELPDESHFGSHRPMNAPRSRHTSPLPSPDPEGHSPRVGARVDMQGAAPIPKPKVPQPSDTTAASRSRESSTSFPSSSFTASYIPSMQGRRRAPSNVDTNPRLFNELPPAQKSSEQHLPSTPSAPFTPLRSASKTSTGTPRSVVSLPPCSRPKYVSGFSDWSTLPAAPNFDICPSCRKAVEAAGFDGHFIPSPQRAPGFETRCDMAIPWVRLAWLLILQKRSPHPNLIHEVVTALASEPECHRQTGAARNWYGLLDPESGRFIDNFDICQPCARTVVTIFPILRGTFHLDPSASPYERRTCDLRTDSHRWSRYIDVLETIANQATDYRRPPNLYPFITLAKKMAFIRECRKDDILLDQAWHYMPKLQEFTVCEECFEEVVYPEVVVKSEVARSFHQTMQMLPFNSSPALVGTSCQLYSPRMRKIFVEACRRNDYKTVRDAVLKRVAVEKDLQQRLRTVERRAQAQQMSKEQKQEEVRALVEEWKKWE